MDLSIVIPVYNEEASLSELSGWIDRVVQKEGLSYEIIFVDDGSKDSSWQEIEILSKRNHRIKAIKFRTNHGKSAALNRGFNMSRGDVVITMDADLQDNPEEIPPLYNMIRMDGFDIVSGWKKKRRDPIGKRWPSKFFNWTTRRISGLKLHDFNCGLKAYSKDVVKSIEIYGEMHRYIPVIAKWAGFRRITEKVVNHRSRKYGKSKYGPERLMKGFLDLISLTFVTKFGKRPMHFFGVIGTLLFLAGLIIAAYLAWAKFFMHEYKMTERPLFYFGLLAMVMGTQVFVSGFVAEMISRNSSRRNEYLIEKVLVQKPHKQTWKNTEKKPDKTQAKKPQSQPVQSRQTSQSQKKQQQPQKKKKESRDTPQPAQRKKAEKRQHQPQQEKKQHPQRKQNQGRRKSENPKKDQS